MNAAMLVEALNEQQLGVQIGELMRREVVYPEDWIPDEHGSEDARPGTRVKRDKEVFAVSRLVDALGQELHHFPLALMHREGPDFLLQAGNAIRVGIEHTEAVPQAEAYRRRVRADMLAAGESIADFSFMKPSAPGSQVPLRREVEASIRTDEPGDGWVGDAAERQWADAILWFAHRKLSKSASYERFPSNWLLIYDNWPFTGVRFQVAGPMVHLGLTHRRVYEQFDSVFVLGDTELLRFRRSGLTTQMVRRIVPS